MDEETKLPGQGSQPKHAIWDSSADEPGASPAPEPETAAEAASEEVRGRYGAPWESLDYVGAEPDEEEKSDGGHSSISFVGHLQNVAEPVANVMEPFVDHIVSPVAGVIGGMIEAANQAWAVSDAMVSRRLRRQAKEPLVNLYEAYPEAKLASPRELGLRFVPVEEIRGTAVAGIAQRGGDFLPLKPFRGENWAGRWRRIREANDRLQPLPPVDLIKYGGEYWVVDGHNRVAVTLYANGVGLDAMVTELVPLDGQSSERPAHLLSYLGEAGEMRAAASGHRPAVGMRYAEQRSAAETAAEAGPDHEDATADPHTYLIPLESDAPREEQD
jgi:hypothetical protein